MAAAAERSTTPSEDATPGTEEVSLPRAICVNLLAEGVAKEVR